MTATVAPYDVSTPTPVPSTAIASAPPPQLSMAGPQATMQVGTELRQMAEETDRYGLHLDTLQAQDAVNKLRSRREDLTFGEKNGFMNVKGGDVLKQQADGSSLLDSFKGRFQAVADDLGKDLSPRARMLFNQRAAQEATDFKGDIAKHSLQQAEHYEGQVFKDGTLQDQNDAARYFQDPAKLNEIADRTAMRAKAFAIKQGMPGDAAAVAAQSNVYTVAIKSLVAGGAQRQALAYYDSVQDKLDAGDRVQLAAAMKGIASDVTTEGVANSALTSVGLPGLPSDDTSSPGVVQKAAVHKAIVGQESGGAQFAPGGGVLTSAKGAQGAGQITPETFARFARPGESIVRKEDNLAVSQRITDSYMDKYGGDWRRAAVAYFSGEGNVAPAGSPTPWVKNLSDGQTLTSQYVQQVGGRLKTGGMTMPSAPPPWQGEGDTQPPGTPMAKGDLKVGYSQAAQTIMARTDLNATEKTKALTLINRQREAVTAFQTAQTASLDDTVAATYATAIVNPSSLAPGTFAAFADQYAALGQASKSTGMRMLASMEGVLRQGLESATDAQVEVLKSLSEGLPSKLIEAFKAGGTKYKTEQSLLGNEKFSQVRKSIETDAVDPTGLVGVAKEAIDHFVHAGKPEEARKIYDFMNSALDAKKAISGGSVAAEQAISDLRDHANKGTATAQQLQTLSVASSLFDKQHAAIKQDPLGNGAAAYSKTVGALPPLDLSTPENAWQTLNIRTTMARRITEMSGVPTPPLTEAEMTQFRTQLDGAPPAAQTMLLKTLGKGLQDGEMIQRVAAGLAGKKDAGDPISRSYAAALSFFADGDPAKDQIADKILRGAAIRKADDAGGRKAATTSDAWLQNWQDQTSTALTDLAPEQQTLIKDAITSVYTYEMHRAGKQSEKLDTDTMNGAIKSVLGEPVTVRGQPMLPPQRGMSRYDVENLLQQLEPADVPANLRTMEGDQITVGDIQTKGRFRNVGEGIYRVVIPDPRRGGDLGELLDPKTGKAWLLDMRPLLERKPFTYHDPNSPDYVAAPPLGGIRGAP